MMRTIPSVDRAALLTTTNHILLMIRTLKLTVMHDDSLDSWFVDDDIKEHAKAKPPPTRVILEAEPLKDFICKQVKDEVNYPQTFAVGEITAGNIHHTHFQI